MAEPIIKARLQIINGGGAVQKTQEEKTVDFEEFKANKTINNDSVIKKSTLKWFGETMLEILGRKKVIKLLKFIKKLKKMNKVFFKSLNKLSMFLSETPGAGVAVGSLFSAFIGKLALEGTANIFNTVTRTLGQGDAVSTEMGDILSDLGVSTKSTTISLSAVTNKFNEQVNQLSEDKEIEEVTQMFEDSVGAMKSAQRRRVFAA